MLHTQNVNQQIHHTMILSMTHRNMTKRTQVKTQTIQITQKNRKKHQMTLRVMKNQTKRVKRVQKINLKSGKEKEKCQVFQQQCGQELKTECSMFIHLSRTGTNVCTLLNLRMLYYRLCKYKLLVIPSGVIGQYLSINNKKTWVNDTVTLLINEIKVYTFFEQKRPGDVMLKQVCYLHTAVVFNPSFAINY